MGEPGELADAGRDDVTQRLAAYASSLGVADIDDEVRREVARRLVDSVACAYGALDGGPVVALREVAVERALPTGCAVWGSGERSTPELAALVNAAAIRLLDYNDYTVGGHPSDNIAAVVAACEWVDATVDDLVVGLVVSYEVWGELGRLQLRYRGWDQGVIAVIAATCAVGRVLGLTSDQLANAIGIAATSNVSLFKVRRGELSEWKGVAVPYAASSAHLIASLAAKGITGPVDAFAGEFGFWQQVSGEFEIEGLEPHTRPVTMLRTGYKHWPVEYDAQFAVWLAQRIRDRVDPADIEHLDVYTSQWTWSVTAHDPEKWAPTTRETADHSLPYIVAVSLARGRIDSADFDESQLQTPVYIDLMARIAVHADEAITAAHHERCAFRAVVRTRSGEELTVEIDEPRSKAMTDDELDDKWARLTTGSRLATGAPGLYEDLRRLDGSQKVRELFAPLVAPADGAVGG
jgi:2-methylcitrate dehydratase